MVEFIGVWVCRAVRVKEGEGEEVRWVGVMVALEVSMGLWLREGEWDWMKESGVEVRPSIVLSA